MCPCGAGGLEGDGAADAGPPAEAGVGPGLGA